MTKRRLKIWNCASMRPATSIALVAIALSASGCGTNIRAPILLTGIKSAFCERYYDAAHPPVWIYESDTLTEKAEKTDLIILWERECEIRKEV